MPGRRARSSRTRSSDTGKVALIARHALRSLHVTLKSGFVNCQQNGRIGVSPTSRDNSPAIHKGFVEVDGRLLHYVRRGRGPALVMLHAAPCSAKVMAPLQAAWANDFTTFAF